MEGSVRCLGCLEHVFARFSSIGTSCVPRSIVSVFVLFEESNSCLETQPIWLFVVSQLLLLNGRDGFALLKRVGSSCTTTSRRQTACLGIITVHIPPLSQLISLRDLWVDTASTSTERPSTIVTDSGSFEGNNWQISEFGLSIRGKIPPNSQSNISSRIILHCEFTLGHLLPSLLAYNNGRIANIFDDCQYIHKATRFHLRQCCNLYKIIALLDIICVILRLNFGVGIKSDFKLRFASVVLHIGHLEPTS
mmetsp:Transcript_2608/g.4443  ORF Transcript_2608/g.4443 Transcript_2608/m.4443 type:complete len:250 (+) Transcript_2608:523-1272(+)